MAGMNHSGSDVVIVGAGVIGVCTAYYLARHGVSVTVVERDEVGKGASFGNAGCIAPGHTPINKPGRVKQAIKSLTDPLSPLYVATRIDPALARWLWDFAHHCTHERVERAMGVLAPMGHLSGSLFDELVAGERLECDYRREGYYDIFLTERALAAVEREANLMRRHGYEVQSITGDELRRREPVIRGEVIGGVYYEAAATVDPYRFVSGLADRAGRLGARFVTGTEVECILVEGGRVIGVRTRAGDVLGADSVILAAGAWTGRLAKRLGVILPLQPAKGYHRDMRPRGGDAATLRATCMLGERSVFCTPMSGVTRFAGTLEFSGLNLDIRQPRLEQLTNAARLYLEMPLAGAAESEWCGLRPCLSDGLPAVGPVPQHPGLFVATGHAMLGLTLGPATGKLLADTVVGEQVSIDLSELRPSRF